MLDGIPFTGLTAPALLGLVVLFFLLGKIVPRNALTDKIEEAAKWQKAYEIERDARIASEGQKDELLEVARLTYSIVSATLAPEQYAHQVGGGHVVQSPTKK